MPLCAEGRTAQIVSELVFSSAITSSKTESLNVASGLKLVAQGSSAVTVGSFPYVTSAHLNSCLWFKQFVSTIHEVINLLTSCLSTKENTQSRST